MPSDSTWPRGLSGLGGPGLPRLVTGPSDVLTAVSVLFASLVGA